ncbi:MAG: response regulator transcription factor [Blastocatellia bacterium]|nr:response regulator transcription factor [Blastocatellia bacterium]
MRILVVEDEPKVARFLTRGLEEEFYAVDVAHDGEAGLYLAEINHYDLIVLDWMLPKKDGLQVLQELRQRGSQTLVLLLTARDAVKDRIRGLDCGADDYLTKPFVFEELLARIRALLRRGHSGGTNLLRVADLTLDLVTHQVTRNGTAIVLTPKEYALLEYFLRNTGKIITKTQISEHVWDEHLDPFSNVIEVYVHYLRDKVDRGFARPLIHTVRGVGYLLKEEPTP